MINLYEFLGIAPTDNPAEIEMAIVNAEQEGKDAKLIMACRNYLFNPVLKAKHDAQFKIKFAGNTVKAIERKNDQIFKSDLSGSKIIMVVIGVLVFGLMFIFVKKSFNKDDGVAENGYVNSVADERLSEDAQAMLAKVKASEIKDKMFRVEGDTGIYRLIYIADRPDGLMDVVVKREGSSGVSYSWRLIDCKKNYQQSLGSSLTTLGKALELNPVGQLEEPLKGSSAYFTIIAACY